MPPKLPSRENASVDEAVTEANELFASGAVAVVAAGMVVAAGRVGAIGCVDEDAIATYMPLMAGEAAGGGIAVGGLGRPGGLVGNSDFWFQFLGPLSKAKFRFGF